MRVSKTFKAIAVPLLYERLEWKHMKKNALGVIKKGNVIRERNSNIVSKNTELQHVKFVELERHTAHTCPLKNVRTRQSPLAISILRVVLMKDTERKSGQPMCLENRSCPLSRGLTAEKLIIITNTNHHSIWLERFNNGQVKDLVVQLEYLRSGPYPRLHIEKDSKRLIIHLVSDRRQRVTTRVEPTAGHEWRVLFSIEAGFKHCTVSGPSQSRDGQLWQI